MQKPKVLVGELGAVDGLASAAVTAGEVTALEHEPRDHTVKLGALEVKGHARISIALLARAEGAKVVGRERSGANVTEQPELDPARGLATDGHVEVNRGRYFSEQRVALRNEQALPR